MEDESLTLDTPELPSGEDDCTHNLDLLQKTFMKVMEEIKQFTKSAEPKFEELEMASNLEILKP